MEELLNNLKETISKMMTYPCNQNCTECSINKQMISSFYEGKNLCDVLSDVFDTMWL
jgi:hypothetical protein